MKRLCVIVVALIVLPTVAVADDAMIQDANDSAGRLDIKSVEVSHPDSGTIRFVVTFYEPHQFTPGGEYGGADTLRIDLRLDGKSPWRFRDILLRGNPDGGLYGVLRNYKGQEKSYVRAWRLDDVSLAVDIRRAQLRPHRLAQRADWVLETTYFHEEVCAVEPGDTPRTCFDVAPHFGFQRHDL